MKKIAITGNLATGKSTVLKILKNLGFSTFSCDEVVKELYEKKEIKNKIVDIFGKEVLQADEKINKRKILERILEDQKFKKQLEDLIHPLVKEKLLQFLETNKEKKLIFCEVPLLFEVGWGDLFDEIWVVTCSENIQRERISKKGLNIETGEKLLKLQKPLKEKKKRAHKVIITDKSLKDLEKEIKEILKEYLKD